MNVRDAVENDAVAMAGIVDAPESVMRDLVHDRTVRVVEDDAAATTDPNADVEESSTPPLLGFVSFDAREDTVHVTHLGGTDDACDRLLEEPLRFARLEGMTVELLVPETDETARDAAERAGFERDGSGPRFQGGETVRYRFG
ncbi:hypothetical protein [Haloarchaeobius sp. TZWWS8]|uniref:hypothetical protein n=1 Tax=Haloarchaeobius sp. TZWWS8 TaxID=3446121 RepID=UPI003EBD3FFB